MCGRFGQIRKEEKYARKFGLKISAATTSEPNFNTDIGNPALVATSEGVLQQSVFGFTPEWSAKPMYLFNARCEGDFNADNQIDYNGEAGIFQKPSFRKAIKSQRLVVPVDYFIEGPEKEKLKKPFLIHRKDGEPFLIAGIWNLWSDHQHQPIHTFSILTTACNHLVSKIGHRRCPLVITDAQMKTWLDPSSNPESLRQMMIPFDDGEFEAFPLDAQIGKRNTLLHPNNSPSLIEPVGPAIFAS